MTGSLTIRQMIAEGLRNGRRWTRSFHQVAPVLAGMIAEGEVHRVKPHNGKANNMVELTGRGWKIYFGENLLISRIDNFAELLAQGFSPKDAGKELFLTPEQADASFCEIVRHLGRQAAA